MNPFDRIIGLLEYDGWCTRSNGSYRLQDRVPRCLIGAIRTFHPQNDDTFWRIHTAIHLVIGNPKHMPIIKWNDEQTSIVDVINMLEKAKETYG